MKVTATVNITGNIHILPYAYSVSEYFRVRSHLAGLSVYDQV